MNSQEVGTKLISLYNEGKVEQIYQELYSNEIVSVEADGTEDVGIDSIAKKNEKWEAKFEIHSSAATGPFPHSDQFIVRFDKDTTHRPSGKRSSKEECGLYTVKEGKVVREEFFYAED